MSEIPPFETPTEGPLIDGYRVLGRKIKLDNDPDDPSEPYFDATKTQDWAKRLNRGLGTPIVDPMNEEDMVFQVTEFALGEGRNRAEKAHALVELLQGQKSYQVEISARQRGHRLSRSQIAGLLGEAAREVRAAHAVGITAPASQKAEAAKEYTPAELVTLRYRRLLRFNDVETRSFARLLSPQVGLQPITRPQITAIRKIYNHWPEAAEIDWTGHEIERAEALIIWRYSLARQLEAERAKGTPPELLERVEPELLSGLNKLAAAIERSKQRR
jgi:hypothetical protein